MTDTTKMNPTIKAQWVAALRSGEYAQGDGVLKTPNGKYCCLGVLTDLGVKAGVEMDILAPATCPDDENLDDTLNYNDGWTFDGEWELTPNKVMEWAGLDSKDPVVVLDEETLVSSSLSSINDNGTPFSEIADLIEKNL